MAERPHFRLSQEQTEKVRAFLNEKWKLGCPMCGSRTLEGGETIVALRIQNPNRLGDFFVGGAVFPTIPIICGNCGNTILVNAVKAGVISKPEEKTDGKE